MVVADWDRRRKAMSWVSPDSADLYSEFGPPITFAPHVLAKVNASVRPLHLTIGFIQIIYIESNLKRVFKLVNIAADSRYKVYEDFINEGGIKFSGYLASVRQAMLVGLEEGGSVPLEFLIQWDEVYGWFPIMIMYKCCVLTVSLEGKMWSPWAKMPVPKTINQWRQHTWASIVSAFQNPFC